ncbi:MAG: glyoxylase-like metal-dependent hydrolase (beta-lactamase superfamily II) [Ilumatobacter sp.]|jgi:glyoxylase-like metal-dependent hydrolase (beta-lactamase superfamily II)
MAALAQSSSVGTMDDLLDLSADIIENGANDRPFNRITQELTEVADGLAVVESFSHSVVVDSGDGLVAFDASHVNTGEAVVDAIKGWSGAPVSHLIYTHGHADHVGGSVAFDAAYSEMHVVGHENVSTRFDRYRDTNAWNVLINARQFGGVREDFKMGNADEPDFIPKSTLSPTHVVGDHDTISVGSAIIELHHARGETDDHLWGWMPEQKWMFAGDFVIWNFPNAGNPQKVQRFPLEWAAALRDMASRRPEVLLPAHGLPVGGADRIETMLTTIAGALEGLVRDVVEMMNAGEVLDTILHSVSVDPDLLAKPYLRPLYDEPEFVIRNIWRQYGGWWDGAPSRLKPAPDGQLALELAALAGGADKLAERAASLAEAGDMRLASHLADFAAWAAPEDSSVHATRSDVYRQRRKLETSLMSKGIFAGAIRESQAISGEDNHRV